MCAGSSSLGGEMRSRAFVVVSLKHVGFIAMIQLLPLERAGAMGLLGWAGLGCSRSSSGFSLHLDAPATAPRGARWHNGTVVSEPTHPQETAGLCRSRGFSGACQVSPESPPRRSPSTLELSVSRTLSLHCQHQSLAAQSDNLGFSSEQFKASTWSTDVFSTEEARTLGALSGLPSTLPPGAEGGDPTLPLSSSRSPQEAGSKTSGWSPSTPPQSCSPIPHSAAHTAQPRQHQEASGDSTVAGLYNLELRFFLNWK